MNKKHIVYIGFGTICGFRHPLGILEHIPCGKEGTIVMLGVGQKMTEYWIWKCIYLSALFGMTDVS